MFTKLSPHLIYSVRLADILVALLWMDWNWKTWVEQGRSLHIGRKDSLRWVIRISSIHKREEHATAYPVHHSSHILCCDLIVMHCIHTLWFLAWPHSSQRDPVVYCDAWHSHCDLHSQQLRGWGAYASNELHVCHDTLNLAICPLAEWFKALDSSLTCEWVGSLNTVCHAACVGHLRAKAALWWSGALSISRTTARDVDVIKRRV